MIQDKKVIIVGPAETDEEEEVDIEPYDVVVRFNRSVYSSYELVGSKKRSKRRRKKVLTFPETDLLYVYRGIDPDPAWKKMKVKMWLREGEWYQDARRRTKGYWDCVEIMPQEFIDDFQEELGCNPNTGILAMKDILRQNPAHLHITGITFYQTPYVDEYRIPEELRHANYKHKGNIARHRQKPQFEWFIDNVYSLDNVTTDQTLTKICEESL